jgi:fido (protein-threonine AMPylation protein)
MFDDVWDWAGKIRTVDLNFGVLQKIFACSLLLALSYSNQYVAFLVNKKALLLVFSINTLAFILAINKVSEVIEPDLLLEIQQKAKQVDWKKLQRNMKLAQDIARLPIALIGKI